VRQPTRGGKDDERGLRMLRGVPALPGWGPACGPLFACLHALGEPVGYPFLAALSGDAFRLRLIELRPHGPTDGVEVARTLGDLGYEVHAVSASERGQVAAAIRRTIDAGVPAIAWSPSDEAGSWFNVVIGCDDGVEKVCLRTLGDDDQTFRTEVLDRVATEPQPGHPGLYLPGAKVGEPPVGELVWLALRQAVRLGREQVETSAEKHPFVQFGVRGYDAWANCLEAKAAGDRSLLVEADIVHGVRMHVFVAVDMKAQAEQFLRSAADEAQGEARLHLSDAADLYHEVWDLLAAIQPRCTSFTRCRDMLADEDRTEELIHALRRVAFLEDLAIGAIAKALDARR
jgi:hypothetical protein